MTQSNSSSNKPSFCRYLLTLTTVELKQGNFSHDIFVCAPGETLPLFLPLFTQNLPAEISKNQEQEPMKFERSSRASSSPELGISRYMQMKRFEWFEWMIFSEALELQRIIIIFNLHWINQSPQRCCMIHKNGQATQNNKNKLLLRAKIISVVQYITMCMNISFTIISWPYSNFSFLVKIYFKYMLKQWTLMKYISEI